MWFSNFTLVLPDRLIKNGSMRIEDGVIAELVEHPVPGGIEGRGMELMPGFIDMHGDMIEQELEPRAGVDFPVDVAINHLDARLAASGITTAYASVSFSRQSGDGGRRTFEHTSWVIKSVHEARGACRVDHKIHARFDITFDNAVGVLADLLAAGAVDLVSLMDHTPGQGQYRNLEKFTDYMKRSHKLSDVDAEALVKQRVEEGTRPQNIILSNIAQVAELCQTHNVPLASHDDDTIEKTKLMVDAGIAISEFPVTFEAMEFAAKEGVMVAMGAPNAMRGKSYSGNLSARDAHAAGHLHILAADYHPGAILPAIRALAETDNDGLVGAVRLATANPAKALGLADRGEIAVGRRADLCLINAQNQVVATYLAGDLIYSKGVLSQRLEAAE